MEKTKLSFLPKTREVQITFSQKGYGMYITLVAAGLLKMSGQFLPHDHRMHESGSMLSDTMEIVGLDQFKGVNGVYDTEGVIKCLSLYANEIYAAIEAVCMGEMPSETFEEGAVRLIIEALDVWQACKTHTCKVLQNKNGKSFGANTELFQKNWTDLNTAFRKKWRL